jgi:Rrf2 family protein
MLLRRDRALLALDIALDIAFHAGRGSEVTGAAEIAERLNAARRGIEPLLQALVRSGLLDSVRGPRGGYRMARAPREVKLAEIIAAVTEDETADAPPGKLATLVTAPLWAELDAAVEKKLQSITLEELLKRAAAAGLRRPVSEPLHFVI